MTINIRFVAMAANVSLAVCAAVALTIPTPAFACSGCGCILDTDEGAGGTGHGAGLSLDERVDYINQNHLSLGGGNAPPQDPSRVEVQRNTTTVFYTTTADYKSDKGWGVNVAVPFQYRYHSTYNNGDFDSTSTSEWNTLSDIKIVGRYTGFTESQNYGVLLGLKLPTGSTNEKFKGATAGQNVDAGLQPGTGSWDLVAGLTQAGSFGERWNWFAQEIWQVPIATNHNFDPGQALSGSVGVRYAMTEMFVPQFQINGQKRWRESGVNGDQANSGGVTMFASPGLFVNILENTAFYGFVQVPIYQQLKGLQLVPDYTFSVGIHHHF